MLKNKFKKVYCNKLNIKQKILQVMLMINSNHYFMDLLRQSIKLGFLSIKKMMQNLIIMMIVMMKKYMKMMEKMKLIKIMKNMKVMKMMQIMKMMVKPMKRNLKILSKKKLLVKNQIFLKKIIRI